MASSSPRSVKVTDLNPHLLCVLCGGYYVDATTIIECLHSFCKSCIVRYLETNKYCPICDVQVHKSKPLLNIRSDRNLQAIVYKLVPGLFQRELNSRKEFYKNRLESKLSSEDGGTDVDDSPVFPPGETLLLAVQYADSSQSQNRNKRYLSCPAAVTISHLQKLMRAKFDLNASQRVEFLHEGDLLPDHISLVDLAYMYHWKRKHPIDLEYRLLESQQKKIKLSHEEEKQVCLEEKQTSVESCEKGKVSNSPADQPDREVQLQISENGVMSVQSVDSSSNNTVLSLNSDCVNTASETSMPVKDIQMETMELMKSLGNDVTLNFDSTLAKANVKDEAKSNREIPTNNNTITNERISDEDNKAKSCTTDLNEDTIKSEDVFSDVKNNSAETKEGKKYSITVNNNAIDKNKSNTNNSSLSITRIPPISSVSTPAHAQKVYPGAVKDGSNTSRLFKTKEVHIDIKRPEVTIKPASEKHEPPKSTSTARYKTLKAPIKPWNPTIPRSAIMAMKQAQAANQEKGDYPGKTAPKAPKFFKMRNVPRFLGNPASGVKPMYQVLPGSELTSQAPQTSVSQTSKPMSTSELTVMKIDPKTLNPITVSHSRSSKLNSSASKPSTTFAPTHKPSERDMLNCGTPIRNPVSKSSSMSLRAPSQVHASSFPSNPFGLPSPHILYPGFPRPFSQVDNSGNQLPADSQILRAMSMLCSPGAAFHPSLPPSISMLFNPHHPHHRSTSDKLNFKYSSSDFHKATTTTTPSVQRIPPSGPSSKISSSASNSLSSSSDSFGSPPIMKELEKHLAEEKNEQSAEESRRSALYTPTNDTKPKSTMTSSNTDRDPLQSGVGKISPLPITNGLSITPKGNLDKDLLKLHNKNVSAKLSVKESTEQNNKEENQRADSKNVSENNCC